MLEVTQQATKHLLHVRQERGFDPKVGARFVRHATRVRLTFAPAPEPGDEVIDGAGIPVYLESGVASSLAGSVIDARPEDGKTVLVIRRHRRRASAPAKPSR
jgi:Fe-S cluster assembly iron-binding protein IscA